MYQTEHITALISAKVHYLLTSGWTRYTYQGKVVWQPSDSPGTYFDFDLAVTAQQECDKVVHPEIMGDQYPVDLVPMYTEEVSSGGCYHTKDGLWVV